MRRLPSLIGPRGALLSALCGLVLLGLGALAPAPSAAGPWVQLKNGYYTTGRVNWLTTSEFYDAEGDKVDNGEALEYRDRTVVLDAEYGLSNKMTFALGMPVQFLSYHGESLPFSFTNIGFGDLKFGLKYGILDPAGNTALAVEIDGVTPTGYNAEGFGIPPLGLGKFNTLGRLLGGITFDPTPAYAQAEIGYRLYSDANTSDALVYGAEAGYFVTPRVLILGEITAQSASDEDLPLFQSYTLAGGLVQYRLMPGMDVMAGIRSTLSGKQVSAGTDFRIGISLKGNDLAPYRGQTSAGYREDAFPGYVKKPRVQAKALPTPTPAPITPETTTTPGTTPPVTPETPTPSPPPPPTPPDTPKSMTP
jgi:hypothetical protein